MFILELSYNIFKNQTPTGMKVFHVSDSSTYTTVYFIISRHILITEEHNNVVNTIKNHTPTGMEV
jgi:hypothetical protein